MHVVIDELDHSLYADVVLSPKEINRILKGEMLSGEVIFKRRKCYVGLRLQGLWDYHDEEDEKREESDEGDERIWPG